MFNIQLKSSASKNSKANERTKTNNGVLSIHDLKRTIPENGKLYRCIFPTSYQQTVIGEATNDKYLTSGFGSAYHYNFLEEIDPNDITIEILTPDGKQTGRELIEENIGGFFDLKRIGDHTKYKYIIEIDGQEVALSYVNCLFYDKTQVFKPELVGKIVEYYGVTLKIEKISGYCSQNLYKARDVYTNKKVYIPLANVELTETNFIEFTADPDTLKPFFDKDYFISKQSKKPIQGYNYRNGKFGLYFICKQQRGEDLFDVLVTKEDVFNKIKEELYPRFLFDKKDYVFYLNPKYRKKVLQEQPRVRRGGRRQNARAVDPGRIRERFFNNDQMGEPQ